MPFMLKFVFMVGLTTI